MEQRRGGKMEKRRVVLFALMITSLNYRVFGERDGFVKTRGIQLELNGYPFYANGFNAYWLMCIASDPSQRDKVSSAFEEARSHGLSMARTWAFSDGGYSPLQYSPGSYNERMFKGLDFVICEARKYGMKLILSFVNNYEDYGGKKQYVDWARSEGQSVSSEDDFFSNYVVKQYYKNHIKTLLTRKNTLNGIAYKDDTAIMAWELINEPRCSSDPSGNTLQGWIREMASHVKSIDGNHLLEIGLEGFYGPSNQLLSPSFNVGTDFIANNHISGIDFATAHSYPDQWLSGSSSDGQLAFLKTWLDDHIKDAQNILKKPLLLTEFGKSGKQRDEFFDDVFAAIYSSASSGGSASGGLFWQLLSEGMDSFRDGYEVVLSETSSTATLIAQHSRKLNRITKMYSRLRNLEKLSRAKGLEMLG